MRVALVSRAARGRVTFKRCYASKNHIKKTERMKNVGVSVSRTIIYL